MSITWGTLIWLYLWLAGIAGAAYFVAFLVERFAGGANRQLLRLATYLGIPLVIIGVIVSVIDLGQPLRFWLLLANFNVLSPMSWGVWILLIWPTIAVIMVILWLAESRTAGPATGLRGVLKVLAWINFVFAGLLIVYSGVLLAVSNQPLWAGTVLLPSLFVASAISTGVAIVIITAVTGRVWAIPSRTVGQLAKTLAIVILIQLALLVGYAIWLGASPMAGTGEALRLLTTGVLAAPFWLGVILLALLVPLGLIVANWGKEITAGATRVALVTSSVCVLLGALVLRAVIVIGGQL